MITIFKLLRRAFILVIIVMISVPGYALAKSWYAAHNPLVRSADAVVVLGTTQNDGRPGEALKARLVEAKRVFDIGLAPLIITVGAGAPGDRTTEAASGRAWLRAHGVSSKKIIAIEIGRDTLSSTKAYVVKARELKIKEILIATDPFHCLRATTMANDLGVNSTCSPVRTGPNSLGESGLRYLVREAGAYLAYITLGRRGIHISDHLGNQGFLVKIGK
ncbi:unannotated protein [freshwater metagenome]|uniref:Unannotated protein n=1 Tax=freshwater metagenome TaxID=449393 RepID=A0A6J7XVX6_9ZZZZ